VLREELARPPIGQLRALLTLETGLVKTQLHSVLAYGGLPLQSDQVVNGILHKLLEAEMQ